MSSGGLNVERRGDSGKVRVRLKRLVNSVLIIESLLCTLLLIFHASLWVCRLNVKVVFELIVVVLLLPCRHISEEILRESICLLIGLVTGNTDMKVIMRLPN